MNREIEFIRKSQEEGKISPEQADMLIKAIGSDVKPKKSDLKQVLIAVAALGALILIPVIILLQKTPESTSPPQPASQAQNDTVVCSEKTVTENQTLAPCTDGKLMELPNNCVVGQGELLFMNAGKKLSLPLIHTDVIGTISGFLGRVSLTQTFINPGESTIEAL